MFSWIIPAAAAKQALAEASRRVDAERARLTQAERDGASAREKAQATIELKLAIGRRDRAERVLKTAESLDERGELDAKCEAFAKVIERDYLPLANQILALVVTNWRLQNVVAKALRRDVPELNGLTSPEFCGDLRLLDIGPHGLSYGWYPAPPSEIKKIKKADVISLDQFRDGDVAASIRAAREIAGAYVEAASKIAALLMAEADLAAAIQQWERTKQESPTWRIASPMERLVREGGPRWLCTAIVLPDVGSRGEPIWTPARVRGYAGSRLGFQ